MPTTHSQQSQSGIDNPELQSHVESNDPLVTADLPAASHLPSRPEFEAPQDTNYGDLTPLNVIAYRLRYAFASSSTVARGRQTANIILRDHWEWEKENILNVAAEFETHLEKAGPYLRDELSDVLDQTVDELSSLIGERKQWYHHTIPESLTTACENAKEIDPHTDIRSALIVSQDTFNNHVDSPRHGIAKHQHLADLDKDDLVLSEGYLNGDHVPSKYGFELPQRFLVARSQSHNDYHVMLPWCGVLKCTGGFSRTNPLCKHEIAALTQLVPNPDTQGATTDDLDYRGPDVHPRFERFIKPTNSQDGYKKLSPRLDQTHPDYPTRSQSQ